MDDEIALWKIIAQTQIWVKNKMIFTHKLFFWAISLDPETLGSQSRALKQSLQTMARGPDLVSEATSSDPQSLRPAQTFWSIHLRWFKFAYICIKVTSLIRPHRHFINY